MEAAFFGETHLSPSEGSSSVLTSLLVHLAGLPV